MELVAVAGLQRPGYSWGAGQQRRHHCIRATFTGEYEVLVEGSFKGARVRDAQHGRGRFYVIGNADPRLGLVGVRESVVHVLAQAKIEKPIARFDLVLGVESQFLDVGVARKFVETPATGQVVRREHREVVRIHPGRAFRGIGVPRQGIAIGVHAGSAEGVGRFDDAQAIVLVSGRSARTVRRP